MRALLIAAICVSLAAPAAEAQLPDFIPPDGALFAYVPLPAFDRTGKPIMRENGERFDDGFCILWKPGLRTRGERVPTIGNTQHWWRSVSYTVDLRAQEVTVDHVWGPDVEALPEGGWRTVSGGTNGYRGKGVSAPMFDAPLPEWPCSARVWRGVLASVRPAPSGRPASGGGSGGGFSFPRPSIVNPCMYTNGHVVPNCRR